MNNRLLVFIAFLVLASGWLAYWFNFGFIHDLEISSSQEHWALLGDFLGGVINPILTFLTILILINSLSLQKEEISKNKKADKVKSFETHFFNMISSQKVLYDGFVIKIAGVAEAIEYKSARAVIALEENICELKNMGSSKDKISEKLKEFDAEDSICSVIRTFTVIIKLIEKTLSDDCGFNAVERCEYYEILINYTDFSLLRLVLMSLKYFDYAQIQELSGNTEFMGVLKKVGVSDYLEGI